MNHDAIDPAAVRHRSDVCFTMVSMLSLTCHACEVTMEAETEDKLADLALEHARTAHGHEPQREHALARIRHRNR